MHFFECACPGPHSEDCEYKEIKGILYARKRAEEKRMSNPYKVKKASGKLWIVGPDCEKEVGSEHLKIIADEWAASMNTAYQAGYRSAVGSPSEMTKEGNSIEEHG